MEIDSNIVLEAANQRVVELEKEILKYKLICMQQNLEINNLKKSIEDMEEKN